VSELHLGIDVGGTKVLGVAIDPIDPMAPIATHRDATPGDVESLVDVIAATVASLRSESIAAGHRPGPLGLGVPGVVDRTGTLRGAPNLLCAIDEPLRARLEDRLGVAVTIENDANCALWAESQIGAGAGASDVVFVALGTGIGGAVMVAGELRVGAHGFAGEPGHMVVAADGVPCPCGRRGCWERYASGAGLAWLAAEVAAAGRAARILELAGGDPKAIVGAHVTAAADLGDPDALAVFDRFAGWVALGIGNLMNILDPDLVIIGGGLAVQSGHYLDRVRDLLSGEVLGAGPHRPTPVVMAQLGPSAGAIGAALLADSPLRRD
jgi:glucokinase